MEGYEKIITGREGDEKRTSGSTQGDPTRRKGDRRMKESLNPIKSQLRNAEREASSAHGDDNVKELFKSIQASFQEMENVFGPLNTLEEDLENELESIARRIDNILKTINETMETNPTEELEKIKKDVGRILEDMEKRMKEGFKSEKKGSDTLKDQDKPTSSIAGLDPKLQREESDKFFKNCGAMERLRGMIDDLDLQVKHCFFCLAVFPENSTIKKRLLIYLWIGWGIVVPVGKKTAEQVAERCFTELVNKGLVNPIYRKHRKIVDSFSMNSRIREVMISEAEKRRFFLSEKKTKEILEELIISAKNPDEVLIKEESLRVVRYSRGRDDSLALVNVNVQEQYLQFKGNVEGAKKEITEKMKNFRVMQLGRWQSVEKPHIEMESIEFLERLIVPWKNLRYLSLQEISRIIELPETIGKLTSLIILNLRACHNLERLPTGIGSLTELTHLDVSGCYLLDHLPRGIRYLSKLQVLKGFVMGNSRSKDPCKLSDLAPRLNNLRKLSITIGQESVNVSGELDKLQEFKALRSLTITWGVVETTKPTEEPTLIAALTFPPELEKLDIRAFPLKKVPEWLSSSKLQKLERLYIRGGKLVSLEGIGNQSVQVLRLRFLKELSDEWKKLKDMFPRVDDPEVEKCPILELNKREYLHPTGRRMVHKVYIPSGRTVNR